MRKTKCPYGHYYDGDIFSQCPVCEVVMNPFSDCGVQLCNPTVLKKGRYLILDILGEGGYYSSYRAIDTTSGEFIAIIEFHIDRSILQKQKLLKRIQLMVNNLNHENIARTLAFFEENGTIYVVKEFLGDALTLSQVISQRNSPLPYQQFVQLASEVCSAVQHIHRSGAVHQSICPNNIVIMENSTVKLFVDWGTICLLKEDFSRKPNLVIAQGFCAPEQYNRGPIGALADIYSLGCTLYFACTGIVPEDSVDRIICDELIAPEVINPDIPSCMSNAILKAMELKPKNRHKNVEGFLSALFGREKKPFWRRIGIFNER